MRHLQRFLRLERSTKFLFVNVLFTMIACIFAAVFVPAQYWIPRLQALQEQAKTKRQRYNIETIVWSVEVIGNILHVTCLPRALTSYILLCRNGWVAKFNLGVHYNNHVATAHAWTVCDNKIVVGDLPDIHKYFTLHG